LTQLILVRVVAVAPVEAAPENQMAPVQAMVLRAMVQAMALARVRLMVARANLEKLPSLRLLAQNQ
jgi:hypothetical protein